MWGGAGGSAPYGYVRPSVVTTGSHDDAYQGETIMLRLLALASLSMLMTAETASAQNAAPERSTTRLLPYQIRMTLRKPLLLRLRVKIALPSRKHANAWSRMVHAGDVSQ